MQSNEPEVIHKKKKSKEKKKKLKHNKSALSIDSVQMLTKKGVKVNSQD